MPGYGSDCSPSIQAVPSLIVGCTLGFLGIQCHTLNPCPRTWCLASWLMVPLWGCPQEARQVKSSSLNELMLYVLLKGTKQACGQVRHWSS